MQSRASQMQEPEAPPPRRASSRSWRRPLLGLLIVFALLYSAGGVNGWRRVRLRLRRMFDPPTATEVQSVVGNTTPPATNAPLTAQAQARAAGGAPASAATMVGVSVLIVAGALAAAALSGRTKD